MSKIRNFVFAGAGTFFLLLFGVSFWFYNDIFNKDNFQTHVIRAVETQESRDAIASLIIDQGFEKRPVLRNLLLDQAAPLLSGALAGPRVQGILSQFVGRLYDSLLTGNKRAVSIDLSNIKSFAENVLTLAGSITGNDQATIKIPDSIIIVKASEVPPVIGAGRVLLWIGPLALIAGIAIDAWLIIKNQNKAYTLKIIGTTLAIGSLILILLITWYKPIFLSMFTNSYVRVVADNIANEFSNELTNQNFLIMIIGIIIIIGGYIYNFATRQGHK